MKMRIVGLTQTNVWFQTRSTDDLLYGEIEKINYIGWMTYFLSRDKFEEMIRKEKPYLIKEYEDSHTHLSLTAWLYHYNETEEMIQKGIAAEF